MPLRERRIANLRNELEEDVGERIYSLDQVALACTRLGIRRTAADVRRELRGGFYAESYGRDPHAYGLGGALLFGASAVRAYFRTLGGRAAAGARARSWKMFEARYLNGNHPYRS